MLLRYLHVLAMAAFVGGQLVLAFAVVPALRGRDREALRAAARRFGWITLVALAVLVATGVGMASRYDDWSSPTLHFKLALVGLVIVLIGVHLRFGNAHWLQGLIFLVSLVIVWLGLSLAH